MVRDTQVLLMFCPSMFDTGVAATSHGCFVNAGKSSLRTFVESSRRNSIHREYVQCSTERRGIDHLCRYLNCMTLSSTALCTTARSSSRYSRTTVMSSHRLPTLSLPTVDCMNYTAERRRSLISSRRRNMGSIPPRSKRLFSWAVFGMSRYVGTVYKASNRLKSGSEVNQCG